MGTRFPASDASYQAIAPRWTAAPTQVSLSTSSARNGTVLAKGLYWVKCNVRTFIKQGGSTITAATTDFAFESGAIYPMQVGSATDGYLAGILASGTGTMEILLVQAG